MLAFLITSTLSVGCGTATSSSPAKAAAPAATAAAPLSGKLTVLVRPPNRNLEPVSVSDAGSLPVRSGGAMCLDVRLSEPAMIYLVWINSAGQVAPLYPWNNETLEVTDVKLPPPERRPARLVFSPLLGRSWTFGDSPGLETVVMLVRSTPLPPNVNIGELLSTLPPPVPEPDRPPNHLLIVEWDRETRAAKATAPPLGGDEQTLQTTAPREHLEQLVARLGEHFDLVEAVQFVHQDKMPPTTSP